MKRNSNYRAFTMVESIVAIVILMVSLSAVIGAIRVCGAAELKSRQKGQAIHLAELLLIEHKRSGSRDYKTEHGGKGIFDYSLYRKPTQIEDLAEICVNVNWNSQGASQNIELKTFVYVKPIVQVN